FFGALLLVILQKQGAASMQWLRTGIAAFLAKTSYCAYLIHAVLAYIIFTLAHVARSNGTYAGIGLTILSFAITFSIAAASYRWFERPLLQFGRDHPDLAARRESTATAVLSGGS